MKSHCLWFQLKMFVYWNTYQGGSRHKAQHYYESIIFFIRHFINFPILHGNARAARAACLEPRLHISIRNNLRFISLQISRWRVRIWRTLWSQFVGSVCLRWSHQNPPSISKELMNQEVTVNNNESTKKKTKPRLLKMEFVKWKSS